MSDHPLLERLLQQRAVAVLRTSTAERATKAAEACIAAGFRWIEITLTVPGALEVVRGLSSVPDVVVGIGTLLKPEELQPAAQAGARFAVSPHFDPELVARTKALGLLAAPGVGTATEALEAHRAGADVIKLFPAGALGPSFLKALREPLPFLRLMPSGGVSEGTAAAWLDAGACALGFGGSLVDAETAAAGNWTLVTERARRALLAVAGWKPSR